MNYSPKSDNLLDIVMATAQLCTFLTLFYALLLKIDFFEAEGISPELTGVVLVSIQILPVLVSVGCCVYAFGQEHVAKAKAAARRVSRRLTAKPRVDDAVREANVEVKMTSSASSSI